MKFKPGILIFVVTFQQPSSCKLSNNQILFLRYYAENIPCLPLSPILIQNSHLDILKGLLGSVSISQISTVGGSGTECSGAENAVVESILPTQGILKLRLSPPKIIAFSKLQGFMSCNLFPGFNCSQCIFSSSHKYAISITLETTPLATTEPHVVT